MTDMRFAGDAILALELTVMLALPALCRTVPGFAQALTGELDDMLSGPLPSPGVEHNLRAIREHVEKG
jgi:hypothetical protein